MRRASLLLALVVAGCGGGRPSARLDAEAQSYRAGEPGFAADAVATVRDGETGVDLALGVPPSSLVFQESGDSLVAVARWTVRVQAPGRPDRAASPVDTVSVRTNAQARDPRPVWRTVRVPVPPGVYGVAVTLEDRASERTARRELQVEVFAPSDRPDLSAIRLEAATGRGLGPVDAASVPAGLDSLRAVTQVAAAPDGAEVVLSVVRLRSDQEPAPPLVAATPARGSLLRRGVDATQIDTVGVVRQRVGPLDAARDVRAPLPALTPGVYTVRLDLVGPGGGALDTESRTVVVRRRDYPALTRLGDLAEPLVYLGGEREVEAIVQAEGAGQRAAFDRFWGERLDDRRLAAATVRAYYDRVEEANRQFSAYKEGWKTDPGMVLILFGPPRYIEATPEGERWVYAQGGAAPPFFAFEQTAGRPGGSGLFSVLTLVRDRAYAEAWERARVQWRSGIVP